jgi:hypothetical protein
MEAKMKRISLEQLQKESKEESYQKQYQYICQMLEHQKIRPVKASPLNGKTPALHQSYWVVEEEPDYAAQIEELKYKLVPAIHTDYYLKRPDVYEEERKWVRLLNRYFLQLGKTEPESVSLNERSFQIWGREKFLQREQGKKILAHCGVALEQLFVYETTEPLAYYSGSRQVPQTILILENKDTFYSMRKYMMDGNDQLFGERIGTVVYGAGKGILRSFADFEFCVEPYMRDSRNTLLYFGDLDYEGIGIYERLEQLFREERRICPFVKAYEKMMEKARNFGFDFLPDTSENQNRNISEYFFHFFSESTAESMKALLASDRYIPQEIINITDYDTGWIRPQTSQEPEHPGCVENDRRLGCSTNF